MLKDLTSKLAEDGWDDVPTLKVIGAEDMEALELTDAQRVSFFFSLPFAHVLFTARHGRSSQNPNLFVVWCSLGNPCASESREEVIKNWQQ